jgi:hypothetical protein
MRELFDVTHFQRIIFMFAELMRRCHVEKSRKKCFPHDPVSELIF